MRIVHLSDLHMREADQRDQRLILSALLVDLAKVSAERCVDAVIFSGDLAHAGKEHEYALAQGFLDQLGETLSLDRGRIVLIPGNHDVDQDEIEMIFEAGLVSTLTDREAVDELLLNEENTKHATARLAAWRSFREIYYADIDTITPCGPLGYAHVIETPEGDIGVAALNSAWRSGAGDDRGRLLLGESQVRAALDAIAQSTLQVAAIHHPLDWLAQFDAERARSELEGRHLILLSGHEHDPDPQATVSGRGSLIHDRAGCLYQHLSYRNAYSILDIEAQGRKATVAIRDWYSERSPAGVFDEATRIAANGIVTLTLTEAVADKHPAFTDVMDSLAGLAFDRSLLLTPPPSDVAVRLPDFLVPPKLSAMSFSQASSSPTLRENAVTLAVEDALGLLKNKRALVVVGENVDDGVTTTLLWLLSVYYQTDGTLLPVFLEDGRRLGTERGARALRLAAAEVGFASAGSSSLPPLLVAIDDAGDPHQARIGRVAAYLADNPGNGYILAVHGDAQARVRAALEQAGVEAAYVHVWPFGRKEVRDLVKRVGGIEDQELVRRVSSLVVSNRLPRNPFIIAALVAVLRAEGDFDALNESSVLAAYVRYVLGATELTESAQLGLDFRRREHLLGCLAEELLDEPRFRITRLQAEQFVADYYSDQGYTRSPTAVLQDLIDRRILIEADDHVGFRQAAFLYLCAGRHMTEIDHPKFKTRMLDEPLRFAPILRHAAGLGRNDEELLARVIATLGETLDKITDSIEPASFDELFENREQRQATLDGLGQSLAVLATDPPAPDDDQADRVDELILAQNGDEELTTSQGPLERLGDSLRLAGQVLRSSEFVKNDALKLDGAKLIVAGQAVIGAATAGRENRTHEFRDALMLAVDALEERGVKLPNAKDVDFWLMLFLVSVVVVETMGHLNAPHLTATIQALKEDSDIMDTPGSALLATGAVGVVDIDGFADDLVALFHRFPDHPYLRELVRELAVVCFVNIEDDEVAAKLRDFLVGIYGEEADKSKVRKQLNEARMRFRERTHDALKALNA